MFKTKAVALLCAIFLAHLAAGQEAVGFVSPNVRDRMTSAQAEESLSSFEQTNFIAVADRVLCALAPHASVKSAIGEVHEEKLGLEGTENSTVLRAPLTYDAMLYAVALLGRYAHQKYVIVFEAEPTGSAQLVTLKIPQTVGRTALERILDSVGLVHRTLVDAHTVILFVEPHGSTSAMRKAARLLHGSIDIEKGEGAVFGDDDRLQAAWLYDVIISTYEFHHPEQKLSKKLWTAEWHDAVSRTCTAAQ